MSKNPLKLIAVSPENYQSLKDLGKAGDSFNDVITKLLHLELMKLKEKQENLSISLAGAPTPNHKTCQPIFFILKARRQKLIAMKECKTAIDKLSEPKLGRKSRNEPDCG